MSKIYTQNIRQAGRWPKKIAFYVVASGGVEGGNALLQHL
jgi:hypothetical protein